jgi:hypothetical protein
MNAKTVCSISVLAVALTLGAIPGWAQSDAVTVWSRIAPLDNVCPAEPSAKRPERSDDKADPKQRVCPNGTLAFPPLVTVNRRFHQLLGKRAFGQSSCCNISPIIRNYGYGPKIASRGTDAGKPAFPREERKFRSNSSSETVLD